MQAAAVPWADDSSRGPGGQDGHDVRHGGPAVRALLSVGSGATHPRCARETGSRPPMAIHEFLERTALFEEVGPAIVRELGAAASTQTFARGSTIWHVGELPQ